jgi:hypothetical protein
MLIYRKAARCAGIAAGARTTLNRLPPAVLLLLVLGSLATASRADLDIDETLRLALADDPVIAARQAQPAAR